MNGLRWPVISNNRVHANQFNSKKRKKYNSFLLYVFDLKKNQCFKESIGLLLIFKGSTREFGLKYAINANC